jgi:hypothetical protein
LILSLFSEVFMSIRFVRLGMIPPLLFTASMAVQSQAFDRQKLGDGELGCQALYDEVKEMEALITANAPSAAGSQNQGGNTTAKAIADAAAREGRSSEMAQFGQLLGRITSGLGVDPQQQQQIEANKAQTRASAQARKQHLTSLFNTKKCKLSTLRK